MRIQTGPISGSERHGFLSAGYVDVTNSPDPDHAERFFGALRIVGVGSDWIDVEAPERP